MPTNEHVIISEDGSFPGRSGTALTQKINDVTATPLGTKLESLVVGTTTTSQPGDDATVQITGTAPAQTLNFSIPRGAPGSNGRGFTPRGAWAASTVYAVDDVVTSGGSTFRVTTAHTSGATAPTAVTPGVNYELWSGKGDEGAAGTAATITVGTTTTDVPGSTASVTNIGSSSAATLDFSIPRGDPGTNGRGITSITDADANGIATITYTDGSTEELPLPNPGADFTTKKDVDLSFTDGVARRYARLLTVDGVSGTKGAYANFILSGTGGIGDADRGSLIIHVGQRGADTIMVRAWAWGVKETQEPIQIYSRRISTYVFEIWVLGARYNQAHSVHLLGATSMVFNMDSVQTTAPTNLVLWPQINMDTPITDHGALAGLADDDHTLYALADGTRGAFAPPAAGVPTGGAAGQVLSKSTATDYATAWVDAPSGGGGQTVNSLFAVRFLNGAWEFADLAAAQTAGLLAGQTIMFIGNPNGTLPTWAREGDIWTKG